jgi:hypothetical protein
VRPVPSHLCDNARHRPPPAGLDPNIAPDCPTQILKPLQERGETRLSLRIPRVQIHEHADPPHPGGVLLCSRRQGPRPRATEECDEVASVMLVE